MIIHENENERAGSILRNPTAVRGDRDQMAMGQIAQGGFSLPELLVATVVFTMITASVAMLVGKSQSMFRTEQGVTEMDQNARLLIDFFTRDVQESTENSIGLGSKFRSIYSYNGPAGKTDEVTIITSDTTTKLPAAALPLIAASNRTFNAGDRFVELMPNGVGGAQPQDVINNVAPGEEFIVSAVQPTGSVQFDFIKAVNVGLTRNGSIGMSFEAVDHKGVTPELPYGADYPNGAFTMRPVAIKRYFVDKTDPAHPAFALSVNNATPIAISRNVVAFQLRYLQVKDGDVAGQWVKEQNISRQYKTQAVEVTMTARTEISGDNAQRLVTLASVIRPRLTPGGAAGLGGGGGTGSGVPGGGLGGGSGNGGPGGDGGNGLGGGGGNGTGAWPGNGGSGYGAGDGSGSGDSSGIHQGDGRNYRTVRIGKDPHLGERLNPDQ